MVSGKHRKVKCHICNSEMQSNHLGRHMQRADHQSGKEEDNFGSLEMGENRDIDRYVSSMKNGYCTADYHEKKPYNHDDMEENEDDSEAECEMEKNGEENDDESCSTNDSDGSDDSENDDESCSTGDSDDSDYIEADVEIEENGDVSDESTDNDSCDVDEDNGKSIVSPIKKYMPYHPAMQYHVGFQSIVDRERLLGNMIYLTDKVRVARDKKNSWSPQRVVIILEYFNQLLIP